MNEKQAFSQIYCECLYIASTTKFGYNGECVAMAQLGSQH